MPDLWILSKIEWMLALPLLIDYRGNTTELAAHFNCLQCCVSMLLHSQNGCPEVATYTQKCVYKVLRATHSSE